MQKPTSLAARRRQATADFKLSSQVLPTLFSLEDLINFESTSSDTSNPIESSCNSSSSSNSISSNSSVEGSLNTIHERRQRNPTLFPVHILPYLYLGNDETAKNLSVLKRCNIRYVINVTSNLPNYFSDDPNFHYLRIPIDDTYSHNLFHFFPEAISFIEKAREDCSSILVHCLAGISRSVTVCLAYLMYSLHSTLEEAFDLLLKQNGTIAPNFHFMATLTCWERQLLHGNEVQPLIPKDAHNKKNSLSREDLRLS